MQVALRPEKIVRSIGQREAEQEAIRLAQEGLGIMKLGGALALPAAILAVTPITRIATIAGRFSRRSSRFRSAVKNQTK